MTQNIFQYFLDILQKHPCQRNIIYNTIKIIHVAVGTYVTGYEHKLELDDVCFNDACTVRLDSTFKEHLYMRIYLSFLQF